MVKYCNESYTDDMIYESYINPVDIAKSSINSISMITKDGEYYVEASDIERYSELNSKSVLESLEDTGIPISNIVVVGESSWKHSVELEKNGIVCMSESACQYNPITEMKSNYDSVVVAKNFDKYFIEANDIQRCSEMNCEDVIDTLNGIISCNEASDIDADNIVVIFDENTSIDTLDTMQESGVLLEASFRLFPSFSQAAGKSPQMRVYLKDIKDADNLCSLQNIDSKTTAIKCGRMGLRLLDIIANIASFVPKAIPIPLPRAAIFLILRTVSWLIRNGEEAVAVQEGKNFIVALDKAIEKEQDPKVKADLERCRDNIKHDLRNMQHTS